MHGIADSGWDRNRGALFIRCACGWEDTWFPPDPHRFEDAMVKEEGLQLARFRHHLETEKRAVHG